MSNDRSSVRSSLHSRIGKGANVANADDIFSEFNKKKIKKSSKNEEFLENIDIDLTYKQLRLGIIKESQLNEENLAATVIQREFRRYLTKRKFTTFVKTYYYLMRRAFSMYFYTFAINGLSNAKLRKKLYEKHLVRMVVGGHLRPNRQQVTWEQFNVIGMFTIHKNIDPDRLCLFVRHMYKDDMRKMLLEWAIVAKKLKQKRKLAENFQLSRGLRNEFKSTAVTFKLWFYIAMKAFPSQQDIQDYPEVAHYVKCLKAKQKMKDMADDIFKTTLKKRVISTLRINRIQNQTYSATIKDADKFAMKSRQKYALAAWLKVISKQKEIYTSKLYSLKKWRNFWESRKHTRLFIDIYKRRSNAYMMLETLNKLMYNMKNRRILNTNMYIKIQSKPSLALALIHSIRGDDDSRALSISMHAWVQYVRKRKNWQMFISKNIIETDHNTLKQKALAGLRGKKYIAKDYGFVQPYFQHTTYKLYQNVMSVKQSFEPYLIVEGEAAKRVEELLSNAKTNRDQREAFFDAWQYVPQDLSLFMRIVLLNMTKKRNNEQFINNNEEKRGELCFKKALSNLRSLNLASDVTFNSVLNAISINNKNALRNRTNTTIRDSIIIAAHESHESAVKMHFINPQFQNVTKLKFNKVGMIHDSPQHKFIPLIDISTLGAKSYTPNSDDFPHYTSMKINSEGFNKQLLDLKNIIMIERRRREIDTEITKRYDRLTYCEFTQKNYKIETIIEAYSRPNAKKPIPQISSHNVIQPKYAKFFTKKAHQIKRRDNAQNTIHVPEKEEKDDNDLLTDDDAERLRLSGLNTKSRLSIELGTRSSFFNDLSSFSNMMKETASKINSHSNESPSNSTLLPIDEDKTVKEEEEEEYFEEEIPEKVVFKEPKENAKVKEIISDKSGVLEEGFNKSILTSAIDTSNIKEHDPNGKYKQFLEILFGKQKKDTPITQQEAIIKRRIINEYRSRKQGSPGISTQGVMMPVTSLVEEYRSERHKGNNGETEAAIERVKEKDKEKEKGKKKEEPKEYQCKYNGRRYYWKMNEEEEEEEKADSFREDLLEMESQDNEMISEDKKSVNEEGTIGDNDDGAIDDKDFDAAAQEEEEELSDEASKYFPSLEIKLPRPGQGGSPNGGKAKKVFTDNGLAMKSVNKVVFKMITNMIRNDDSSIQLVETEDDEMPSLDIPSIQQDSKESSKENLNKLTPVHKPKRIFRHPNPKTGKPNVIPAMNTISPEMATVLHQDESLTKTIYDNGEVRVMKGTFKPEQKEKQKRFRFTAAAPLLSTGFIDGQVVSFASGSRGIKQKPHNFTNVRITASKQRGITRPIIGQSQHLNVIKPGPIVNKPKEKVYPVYGTLINIASDLSEKDKNKFKVFAARVRSMRRSSALSPVVDKSPDDINTQDFHSKIQTLYVTLATDQDIDKTENDLIKIAEEKPAFLGVLQRAVSQVTISNKNNLERKQKKQQIKEKTSITPNEMASKFVDLSWMKIDTKYKAVALQFADTENNQMDAIIAPTYEVETPPQSRRPKTAMVRKPKSWDEVIGTYDLNEMMLVTPCKGNR